MSSEENEKIKGYLDAIEKASSPHEVNELTYLILNEVTGLGVNLIRHLSESWLANQTGAGE